VEEQAIYPNRNSYSNLQEFILCFFQLVSQGALMDRHMLLHLAIEVINPYNFIMLFRQMPNHLLGKSLAHLKKDAQIQDLFILLCN
jgi:hypothetical protein